MEGLAGNKLNFETLETATLHVQSVSNERPYTCQISTVNPVTCDTISFPVDASYNRVCGCIKAYEFGTPDAFFQHNGNALGINEAYLSGISITHSGTLGLPPSLGGTDATNIWSFAAGATQSIANPTFVDIRCPCDGGRDPPTFVGEDYFCESAIDADLTGIGVLTQFDNTFFFRECLWDGEGCADTSTCCSRIDHPYFIKYLNSATSDPIDLRVCNNAAAAEDFAIEQIELYIQTVP